MSRPRPEQVGNTPADKLVAKYAEASDLRLVEVAARLGVHKDTIRRVCASPKVRAPSKAVRQGGLKVYLFTPEDVAELDRYFADREGLLELHQVDDHQK